MFTIVGLVVTGVIAKVIERAVQNYDAKGRD